MTPASNLHGFLLTLVVLVHLELCRCDDGENATASSLDDSPFPSLDYSEFPSPCSKDANRQFRLWFMPPFYSMVCCLGLLGNLLVVATVSYFKRLKTMTDVYLLNLSLADLLLALSLPLWVFSSTARWVLGLPLCRVLFTAYKTSFYSSMFLLSSISVDRYFAIAKAVSAHRHRSRAPLVSKVSSAFIWAAALIFSVPEMVFTGITDDACSAFSSHFDRLSVGVHVSQIVFGFALPLLVMAFCYSAIVRTLYRARNLERNKAIKVILAVVVVFLLCQVPYNLVLLWTAVVTGLGGTDSCGHDNGLVYAADVTQSVAFLRCCLNPFVYAFVGVKFRGDLLKLLKVMGCLSQERFVRYAYGRRSSGATDTETTTTFSP